MALLRVRPMGMKWPEIVSEIDVRESALDLWHRLVPPDLLDTELAKARCDIDAWLDAGFGS